MPDAPQLPSRAANTAREPDCDICGSARVVWRKCKLICENCGTILKSCADL